MAFNLAKPNRTIRAGILLMGGKTELLDIAPMDFFNGISKPSVANIPLSDSLKSQGLDIEFYWVSELGKPARLSIGGSVETTSFTECPSLDIVLIGAHDFYTYTPNENELAFVRKAYEDCSAMLLICAGFIVAQAAGLLKGKTCTAPRMLVEVLRKNSPETEWIDARWAHDGKIWTSGALLNGLDTMTAFVREVWGGEGSLVESMLDIGGWPLRSAEYAPGEGMKGISLQAAHV